MTDQILKEVELSDGHSGDSKIASRKTGMLKENIDEL